MSGFFICYLFSFFFPSFCYFFVYFIVSFDEARAYFMWHISLKNVCRCVYRILKNKIIQNAIFDVITFLMFSFDWISSIWNGFRRWWLLILLIVDAINSFNMSFLPLLYSWIPIHRLYLNCAPVCLFLCINIGSLVVRRL